MSRHAKLKPISHLRVLWKSKRAGEIILECQPVAKIAQTLQTPKTRMTWWIKTTKREWSQKTKLTNLIQRSWNRYLMAGVFTERCVFHSHPFVDTKSWLIKITRRIRWRSVPTCRTSTIPSAWEEVDLLTKWTITSILTSFSKSFNLWTKMAKMTNLRQRNSKEWTLLPIRWVLKRIPERKRTTSWQSRTVHATFLRRVDPRTADVCTQTLTKSSLQRCLASESFFQREIWLWRLPNQTLHKVTSLFRSSSRTSLASFQTLTSRYIGTTQSSASWYLCQTLTKMTRSKKITTTKTLQVLNVRSASQPTRPWRLRPYQLALTTLLNQALLL